MAIHSLARIRRLLVPVFVFDFRFIYLAVQFTFSSSLHLTLIIARPWLKSSRLLVPGTDVHLPAMANKKPLDWRQAVYDRMYEATLAELKDRYGTTKTSFNYRWEHVTTVVRLAMKLADLTGADKDIVEAAAWLHDIRKYADGERHPETGAAFTREYLPTTDFPPDKIDAVAAAIADHMGLWRDEPLTNLEAQVLWDADKLAKIGLTAIFHWTGGSLAGSKMQTLDRLINRGRANDWQARTVASMHTAPARRAAEARYQAYLRLYDALEAELSGDDLE